MLRRSYTSRNPRHLLPEAQAYVERETARGWWVLWDAEEWWRDRYEFILQHGYTQRTRFRPGLKPSWIGTDLNPYRLDDGYRHLDESIISATRVADGKPLIIRRIIVNVMSTEVAIGKYLTNSDFSNDPANHAVPVLDVFRDVSHGLQFVVMPVLRHFDDPPFSTVSEVTDFVFQTLEGIEFLHGRGVAHQDCSIGNIMMDATPLYPDGFHPINQDMLPSFDGPARHLTRRQASPVKYYFIDFGISRLWLGKTKVTRSPGAVGRDRDVPERQDNDNIYNPFLVDIFLLGYPVPTSLTHTCLIVIRTYFLAPLADAMMKTDPEQRPTPSEALALFRIIINEQSGLSLRRRLQTANESLLWRMLQDLGAIFRELLHVLTYFLGGGRQPQRPKPSA
ncbi:hypothetical protein BD410DRAFT_722812 [Rickenella mellea]|uniref:Protein kinase domain-containing protein n=1 Tax=Rickenella mellea TaxID=50990 RepID=A0A4Y7Q4L6_9AGAM|nr:hypothetical protein BD410DRAFT_722812 [Rickenella mellea]